MKLFDQAAVKKSEAARLAASHPDGWQMLQETIEAEANELEQQLARRVSSFAEEKALAHVSWRDVQKKLQPGEAAVEFVRFYFYGRNTKTWMSDIPINYAALVVTHGSGAPVLIRLGNATDLENDPLCDYRLRVGLGENRTARGVSVIADEKNSGPAPKTTFYDAFWKPLEPALKGARRIYISPDGALNQLALGAVSGKNGRLLMEKYDLRIVSSTKDILRDTRTYTSKSAVLIGNPDFDLDETQQRAALRSLGSNQSPQPAPADGNAGFSPVANLRSRDLSGATLPPLPGTQKEIQAISLLLKKQDWSVLTYTQQSALKEAVVRVQAPRVLHLATHGFFEPDQTTKHQELGTGQSSRLEDPMLRSGLFFAGANHRLSGKSTSTDLDDGVLTAYEVSSMNLQGTELVVLSACETGLGENAAGEGVFGLRRALQVAGAESILLSMWSVPDKETQELMTLFYEKWLAGEDKHQALREAELEMRARVKSRYRKDLPQYWAAFVLVGR
jgi:CHAT domain-containing protein